VSDFGGYCGRIQMSSSTITEEVSVLPGVQQVVVNLGDKSVRVNHEGKVSLNELIKAINEAGYDEVSVLA